MPQCKKCNGHFPARIKVEGKQIYLQNRKYCFECSPFKYHNTKKLELLQSDDIIRHCKICDKDYLKTKSNKLRDKCGSCHVNKQKHKKKKILLEMFGNKCSVCGYSKCSHSLAFHHKDPKTKLFTISGAHSRKLCELVNEAKKCVLLCHNCHSEFHFGLISLDKHEIEYMI